MAAGALLITETIEEPGASAMNEIVFPAGILQPPFFDEKADDATNYGALASTITVVDLTIRAVNDAPVAVADTYATDEDTPLVVPAVKRPVVLIVPPPLTVHVNAGCGLIGWPFWSLAVAENCLV